LQVFVVCGIGSFIPITLEQLARENGVLLSDHTTPCKATLPASVSAFSPHQDNGQCVVYLLGVEINTASFAMYTFSLSVLIQALLIISMSGAADHGRFRKSLLLNFAFIGSTATMLFLPIVPKVFILGAVLAIIANTCFGASFVLLNSFLPLLVRFHPTVRYANTSSDSSYVDNDDSNPSPETSIRRDAQYSNELAREENVLDGVVDATTALIPRQRSSADLTVPNPTSTATPSVELALSTKISSYGIAIGYIAALLVQTVSILVVIAFRSPSNPTIALRVVLFIIGLWWFLFTIPTALWLRPRPGPPLNISSHKGNLSTTLAYFTHSWKSLFRTAKHARCLKDVLLFLAAWFLLSDSIATVSGTAVLFAKTTLGMGNAMLALINVIATVSGVLGAFTWSRISIFLRLKPSQTILACILLFELIPLYGLLGYIPAVQRLGVIGLQQKWEMYPLGAVYGFVLGGLSSYCRSLFGELIPPGYEAAFYALYAITDKGSSIFGPAIVGAITDAYGEIRPVSPVDEIIVSRGTTFTDYTTGFLVFGCSHRTTVSHHDDG
jgi:UMF1 family MFS transporter